MIPLLFELEVLIVIGRECILNSATRLATDETVHRAHLLLRTLHHLSPTSFSDPWTVARVPSPFMGRLGWLGWLGLPKGLRTSGAKGSFRALH